LLGTQVSGKTSNGGKLADKEALLKEVNFIHAPLLHSMRHFISVGELSLMKQTAKLINAAHGSIFDELLPDFGKKKKREKLIYFNLECPLQHKHRQGNKPATGG